MPTPATPAPGLAALNQNARTVIEKRYLSLGGVIQVIHKPGVGHHPHGLENPEPVVQFILDHTVSKR